MAWLLDDCSELRSMENTHASHCGPTKSILDFGSVEGRKGGGEGGGGGGGE